MLLLLLTLLISFVGSTLFGYSVHWALHQSWAGRFNSSHMTHHLKLYPPSDFTSDVYRHAGKDSTIKTFTVAAIPLVALPIILGVLGILSWPLVLVALVVEGLMGFLHDYLHDSMHIENHFLTRIPVVKGIFQRWVHLHYLHHVDMSKNYGIFVFHWDRLFRTFQR